MKTEEKNIKTFTKKEAIEESTKYFNGDVMAADVWLKKYALRDIDGNIYELTPEDMHRRLASEFARIEKNTSLR
jgi:ribonucleoside-diphosphate reductase alpha chain